MSEFKFINRGFDKTLLLLPGWACDWRVFAHFDFHCNYIYAPAGDVDIGSIVQYLKNYKFDKISLLGFSMGSFTAARMADEYPEFIEQLFLVSTTLKPDALLMEDIMGKVAVNHRAFLIRFYANCFSRNDIEALRLFRRDILNDYLNNVDKDILLEGLDFLRAAELSVKGINNIKDVTIYHGVEDKVFDVKDIMPVQNVCPDAHLQIIPATGHVLLFNHGFLSAMRRMWSDKV